MKIVLLTYALFFQFNAKANEEILQSVGIDTNLKNVASGLKVIQRSSSKKNTATIKFDLKNSFYEVVVIKPATSEEFEKEKRNGFAVISNSYGDQPTPYKGEITNIVKCSDSFKPKIQESLKVGIFNVSIIESKVDKNRNYGVCEKPFLKFNSCTAYFYENNSSSIFKIRIASPLTTACAKLVLDFIKTYKQ